MPETLDTLASVDVYEFDIAVAGLHYLTNDCDADIDWVIKRSNGTTVADGKCWQDPELTLTAGSYSLEYSSENQEVSELERLKPSTLLVWGNNDPRWERSSRPSSFCHSECSAGGARLRSRSMVEPP